MKIFLSFILISGIVINAIILWLLSKKSQKELSHKILKYFFICILFIIIEFYADLNDLALLFVLTFNIADTSTLLIGPLSLIYIKSLFNDDKHLIKKNKIHFLIPLLYFILISIPFLFTVVFSENSNETEAFLDGTMNYIFFTGDLYLFGYLIISYRTLNSYLSMAKTAFSNLKGKDFKWVKNLFIGSILIIILDISTFIYDFIYPDIDVNTGFLTIFFLVLFLYYLSYYGIKQTSVLVPEFLLKDIASKTVKKSNLVINDDKLAIHIETIKTTIQQKELFLDEDLTLNTLAKEVNLKEKKLSAIINQKMNTSFYDLINSYRIEEFKKRVILKEYENITLLGVAYDCGFKSKSTFNRLFKLKTNLSPSAYKKMHN